MIFARLALLPVLSLVLLSACSEKVQKNPPLVAHVYQAKVPAPRVSASIVGARSDAVVTEVTLRKASLLNRAFLYGSSLQFSSLMEDGEPTNLMAIAIGQVPAEFRVIDNKLRLVTDARMGFESDINHPSRLVHEFPILKQDAETITVRADQASPTLAGVLFGSSAPASRASWIRSFEYVGEEELFLIESSIELADGSLAEFMESIVPREKQVPAGFTPIYDDIELNPLVERYRFLDAGPVYVNTEEGRKKTAFAQRFLLKDEQPVRWYVTRNIPEKYVADVKNGIEAWNRYSRAMWNRDLMKFEGLLPEHVKVGDPRYNVIVWDNVQDAGSAYESQLSDPLSGIQAHSLIYLPLAWINIGKEYWSNAGHSDDAQEKKMERISRLLKSRSFMGRRLPVNCIDGAHLRVSLEAKLDPETFARQLLKGVLFHEVGHALGLAHNFKGSLAFDPDDAGKVFTNSIMDYNQYNEEEGVFESVDSGHGPLLEYDRQILSVLYNEGKDVKEEDPFVPVCNDAEADSRAGGIDPLCVRYDIGPDPTKQALRSLKLLSDAEARNGRMRALPRALAAALGDLPPAQEMKTLDEAIKGVRKLLDSVKGVSSVYIGSTANSLAFSAAQAVRPLYVIRRGALPEGYSESEMRDRALSLLELVKRLDSLPGAARDGYAALGAKTVEWLASTPALSGMSEEERAKAIEAVTAVLGKAFENLEASLLSRVRTRVAGQLMYSDAAPLSFHERNGEKIDLEVAVISVLENLSGAQAGDYERPIAERAQAVRSLLGFRKTEAGEAAVERVRSKVRDEIRNTRDAVKREDLRKLLRALS